MSSCCPAYDHHAELLERLLRASPLDSETEKSLFYLQHALADLREAGCPVADQRALLLPAVLQLSMSDAIEEPTKGNLRAWLELQLAPAATRPIRLSTSQRL